MRSGITFLFAYSSAKIQQIVELARQEKKKKHKNMKSRNADFATLRLLLIHKS